jgi:hypothetical protein
MYNHNQKYAMIAKGSLTVKRTWWQSLKGFGSEMHSLWHGPHMAHHGNLPILAILPVRQQSGTYYSSTCCKHSPNFFLG